MCVCVCGGGGEGPCNLAMELSNRRLDVNCGEGDGQGCRISFHLTAWPIGIEEQMKLPASQQLCREAGCLWLPPETALLSGVSEPSASIVRAEWGQHMLEMGSVAGSSQWLVHPGNLTSSKAYYKCFRCQQASA